MGFIGMSQSDTTATGPDSCWSQPT